MPASKVTISLSCTLNSCWIHGSVVFCTILLLESWYSRLFNLSRLRAKGRVRLVTVRDLLFADDTALVAHSKEHLQVLLDNFSSACKNFGLTISLKKTHILTQGEPAPSTFSIDGCPLENTTKFTYLGSTVCDKLSLKCELSQRIGKACSVLACLTFRVSKNEGSSLPSTHPRCAAVWLRNLDNVPKTWAEAARIPYSLPKADPRSLLAGRHV